MANLFKQFAKKQGLQVKEGVFFDTITIENIDVKRII